MVIIGQGTGDLHITQTTLASDPGPTTLLVTNFDELEVTSTGTYVIINYIENYEPYIDIPDDEPMETILLVVHTRRGYLRIPIKYLRKSMHPG